MFLPNSSPTASRIERLRRMSQAYNPGSEVSPTFDLLGPGGRVEWHDGQTRPRHLKAPAAVVADVEAAIGRRLSAASARRPANAERPVWVGGPAPPP